MPKNILRMQRAINKNKDDYTKEELDVVTVNFNIYSDGIKRGIIKDVPTSILKWFLIEWTRVVQTFEKVLDFSTCFVENTVMFFKGLKRIKRSPGSNNNEYMCFYGVV